MKPKPFHVGTKVKIANVNPLSRYNGLAGTVVAAFEDQIGWCMVQWGEGILEPDETGEGFVTTLLEDQSKLVHADDGAPLGEWEPLDPARGGMAYEYVYDLPVIPIAQVNAILRGETTP